MYIPENANRVKNAWVQKFLDEKMPWLKLRERKMPDPIFQSQITMNIQDTLI